MTAQKVPFDADNVYQLMKKITDGSYDPLPKQYSIEIATLVQMLLNIDPEKRPSCQEILELGFIKKIEKYLEENYNLKSAEDYNYHTKMLLGKTIKFVNLEALSDQLKGVRSKSGYGRNSQSKINGKYQHAGSKRGSLKSGGHWDFDQHAGSKKDSLKSGGHWD